MPLEKTDIRVKRVYDPPEAGGGLRVLVDRLWPRGLTKDKAAIDLWLRDLAPSDMLRKRLHADPFGWDRFVADYAEELKAAPAQAAIAALRGKIVEGPVTLLFAAKNEERNNATALRDWLVS